EKGAKGLITQFGSLEGVYEHLDELKPAQRKKLEEHRDKAFMSRDLARIKCDLSVDNIEFASLKRQDPDRPKLHDVVSRLEFASLMQEFLPEAPPVPKEYRPAGSARDVIDYAKGADPLAIWVEPKTPDGFDAPMAISFSRSANDALVVAMSPEL